MKWLHCLLVATLWLASSVHAAPGEGSPVDAPDWPPAQLQPLTSPGPTTSEVVARLRETLASLTDYELQVDARAYSEHAYAGFEQLSSGRVAGRPGSRLALSSEGPSGRTTVVFDGTREWVEVIASPILRETTSLWLANTTLPGRPFDTGWLHRASGVLDGEDWPGTVAALLDWNALRLVGKAEVDGRPCYVLEGSGQLERWQAYRRRAGRSALAEVAALNLGPVRLFTDCEGNLLRRWDTVGGLGSLSVHYSQHRLNQSLPDERFTFRPDGPVKDATVAAQNGRLVEVLQNEDDALFQKLAADWKASSRPVVLQSVAGARPASRRLPLLTWMLAQGADLDARDELGGALHTAAMLGDVAVAGWLLEHGARLDLPGLMGRSPLHFACAKGHTATARLLLQRGSRVDAPDDDRQTALHLAARGGYGETVRLLLSRGARRTLRDAQGRTPADVAQVPAVRRLLRQ